MAGSRRCNECGADLAPESSPGGLCPNCLLKLALPESGDGSATTRTESSEQPPSRQIGPYRLQQKVGEGGMGEVWLAEQRVPLRRKVAVKLIKKGMDTAQVIARFEAERQALALMNHPNIAKVLDAGATEDGRPYFVMEYVPGVSISRYCDSQRVTTTERLRLFMSVCDGVQHAHQKGIIHRDLKPSNVLVELRDGKPVPKIIDFGVAKATQQRLTERSMFTEFGVLIGTPEYMSPEQAELTGLDIDTRTDVYSLGMLLYELLVGALPFDVRELRAAGFDEMRRRIREEEPSKPSTRITTLGDASQQSARFRHTDPASLARELRGDLDWISMHALEKDRARRYGSPSDLAADIRRHLRHEPILAGPPGVSYRAGKFVRRHRIAVSAAAAVLVALIVGLGAATYGLIEARRANERTRQEAATAEQVSEFLVELFEVSDPSESRGNSITAREILDRGAERIGEKLEDQPELRSRMLGTLGRVYTSLGLLADAEQFLDEATQLERDLPFDERLERDTLHNLASARHQLGRFEEAEQAYLAAVEERRRVLGEDHPATASSMAALGNLYRATWRLDEAEDLLSRAVDINRTKLGDDEEATLDAKGNLAVVYMEQGRFEEAAPLLEEVLAGMCRTYGDDHVKTLTMQRLIGNNLTDLGDYEEAERVLLECADAQRRVLGPDHPRLQETLYDLALVYRYSGRYPEARRFYRDSLRIVLKVRGENHPLVFACLNGVGETFLREQRYDEAEASFSEAMTSGRKALGEHSVVGVAASRLARVRKARGRLMAAEELLTEALGVFRSTMGETDDWTINTLVELAAMKALRGQRERALSLLGEAVDLGFSPAKFAENPDFASIQDDPGFLALVGQVN